MNTYDLKKEPIPLNLSQPLTETYRLPFAVEEDGETVDFTQEGYAARQRFFGGRYELLSVGLSAGAFTLTAEQKAQLGRDPVTHTIEIETPTYGIEVFFAGNFELWTPSR